MLGMLPTTGFTQKSCVFIPQESSATIILPHHTNIEQLQITYLYLSGSLILFRGFDEFLFSSQQPLWNYRP